MSLQITICSRNSREVAAFNIPDNLVTDSCILPDCNKMPVNSNATALVFSHFQEMTPRSVRHGMKTRNGLQFVIYS